MIKNAVLLKFRTRCRNNQKIVIDLDTDLRHFCAVLSKVIPVNDAATQHANSFTGSDGFCRNNAKSLNRGVKNLRLLAKPAVRILIVQIVHCPISLTGKDYAHKLILCQLKDLYQSIPPVSKKCFRLGLYSETSVKPSFW